MNVFYVQAIFTASLGGVLFGYDMGVIAGALPPLSAYFQLTPSQEEWVVSLLYFGGGVGAASGGFLCDWFGRKFAILFTDVMFWIGALLLYSAKGVESIYVGRCVVGWAVAVSGIADVAYLHEISSVWGDGEVACEDGGASAATASSSDGEDGEERQNKQKNDSSVGRGSVVSVNEACISLGFLMAYGLAFALSDQSQEEGNVDDQPSEEWRFLFACGGILATIQFLGMLFMPESPTWLHGKGRIQEAMSARNKILGIANDSGNLESGTRHCRTSDPCMITSSQHVQESQSVEIEMNTSSTAKHSRPPSPGSPQSSPSSFSAEEDQFHTEIRQSRFFPTQVKAQYRRMVDEILDPYKRQCAISFFLAAFQQFCGHTSVLNFSSEIFSMLNQSGENANLATDEIGREDFTALELTVGIGVLKFLTTCIVIMCVEKGGRRLWLLTGMSCILISLTFLCIAFINCDVEDIGDSSGRMHQHPSSPFMNDLGIVGIYGIAIGYAASFGPLTWLITSELFHPSIRGRALGFSTIITYMAAGLVSNTFLSLQRRVGLGVCFSLYWVATFVALLFTWLGVPDTGGDRTPEDIERELNDMWIWGGRRRYRRCPPLWRWKSRSGERSPSRMSWTSVGSSYGSNSDAEGVSSNPPLGADNTGASSTAIASSSIAHSGLTTRRSISNATKDIT